jgi:DNA-binding MarR family transcriptional regulator
MSRASSTTRSRGDRTPPAADEDLVAIERAMIRIRRRQSRRTLLGMVAADGATPPDLEHVAVIDAVDEGMEMPGHEVTVGDIAQRLGIDPSRASRVVTAAIKAGYVRRVASQNDGRRICLELTDAGRQVTEHAHRTRQALYNRLLEDWSAADRTRFARLLTRFTDALLQSLRD